MKNKYAILWNILNNLYAVDKFVNGTVVIVNGHKYRFNEIGNEISIMSREGNSIYFISDDKNPNKNIFTRKELIRKIKNKDLCVVKISLENKDELKK